MRQNIESGKVFSCSWYVGAEYALGHMLPQSKLAGRIGACLLMDLCLFIFVFVIVNMVRPSKVNINIKSRLVLAEL